VNNSTLSESVLPTNGGDFENGTEMTRFIFSNYLIFVFSDRGYEG